MTKAVWSAIVAVAFVLIGSLSATSAFAQTTAAGTLNVTANVGAKAKLTLGAASITFADADPDTTPTLTSAAVSVDVKARTSAAGNVTLTILASDDLLSGTDAIPISNLSWTAAGDAGFVGATADKTSAVTAGSWTGSGSPSGSQTFQLVNDWAYVTGTYTVTLNYTLSAP